MPYVEEKSLSSEEWEQFMLTLVRNMRRTLILTYFGAFGDLNGKTEKTRQQTLGSSNAPVP